MPENEKRPHGLRMRGLNFLIHYNKVEVYALIFGHILFNSTLGRKTALSQPILSTTNIEISTLIPLNIG
jgi:hypothetical protein